MGSFSISTRTRMGAFSTVRDVIRGRRIGTHIYRSHLTSAAWGYNPSTIDKYVKILKDCGYLASTNQAGKYKILMHPAKSTSAGSLQREAALMRWKVCAPQSRNRRISLQLKNIFKDDGWKNFYTRL